VDLIGEPAHPLLELTDHQGVDVFVGRAVVERRILRIRFDGFEGSHQRFAFFGGEDARAFQRACERLGTLNVGVDQLAIEVKGAGEALENFRRAFGKASAPKLHTFADFFVESRTTPRSGCALFSEART
jgi:hypothetical protein